MKPKTMIVSKRRKSLNTIENLTHKYNSYCCPLCSTLPEILSYREGTGTILLKCKNHGENSLEIQEYIEKMEKFQSESEIKVKNKCITHNQYYSYYCNKCQENFCEKCREDHKTHEIYEIESVRPNNNEIFLIKERINMYLQKKDELILKIKNLDNKITFFDTLINTYENQPPNYLVNLNLKHLLYEGKFNLDKIQNIESSIQHTKKDTFDDFVKKNILEATKGLDKLVLINKDIENELMEDLIKGFDENNIIYNILISDKQIQGPNELLNLQKMKYLNLRGNKISSLDFFLGNNFPVLEILSLNDNELNSIDNLKNISVPLLKELYLSKNKIDNIDILSELKTKKLRVLWLSNNKIKSIDILEKVNFPELSKLCLSKNNINDISVFDKKRVKFPQLYELYLNNNEFDTSIFSKLLESLFLKVEKFYY